MAPTQASEPGEVVLIDIPVEKLFYKRSMFAFLFFSALVVVTLGIALWLIDIPLSKCNPVVGGSIAALVWLSPLYVLAKVAKRDIDARLRSDPHFHLTELMQSVTKNNLGLGQIKLFRHALRRYAAHGCQPAIVRLWPEDQFTGITPLDVQIEPIELDESDAAFDELSESLGDGISRAAGNRYDATLRRRVRRNIKLTVGWIMMVGFGFNMLIAVTRAYRERRVNEGLIIFPVLLLMMLFEFHRLPLNPIQNIWLLVSGGLVVRKKKLWRRRITRHLFDARNSVLCLYRLQGHSWGFIVADAERCETRVATKRELDLLLRVWTSPVPPPTMEQLESLLPD